MLQLLQMVPKQSVICYKVHLPASETTLFDAIHRSAQINFPTKPETTLFCIRMVLS